MTKSRSCKVDCICDGKTDIEKIFSVGEFSYWQCKNCHSVHRSPKIQILPTYPDEYYGESETEKFWFSPIISMLNGERNRRAGYILKRARYGDNIIDIGCGNGKLLEIIQKNRPDTNITGIELDSKAAKRASKVKNIKILDKPFQNCLLRDDHYNIIMSIHSFEHIPDPNRTIEQICKIAAKEAIVYIAIPNVKSTQYKLFREHWLHLDPEWHLHLMSPDILQKKMEILGFKQIDRKYFHPTQNLSGFILSALNIFTSERDLLFNFLKNKKSLKSFKNILNFGLLSIASIAIAPFAIIEDVVSTILKQSATVDMVFEKTENEIKL